MPYGLRRADEATLEVFGGKLRVKDQGLDSRKIAECKTYTNPSTGFTIEHENKAVVHIIFTSILDITTDATTAIADGSVVGQKLKIMLTASAAFAQLTIKNNANTKLLGDWVRALGSGTAIPAWIELVWDGTDWQQNNTNDGTPTAITGQNAHAEGTNTTSSGAACHAEGGSSIASNNQAHAEGNTTTASGSDAHSEGMDTEASGHHSHAGGALSIASGWGARAIGLESVASLYTQFAHAGGKRSANGDAQFTRYVMKVTTTNASATELKSGGAYRFTLDDDKVYACRINIVAMKSDLTQTAWFNRMVLVSRGEGANDVAKVAEYTIQDIGSNAGAPPTGWAVTFTADDANDSLKIQVTGAAATTIYWVAVIECVEVA